MRIAIVLTGLLLAGCQTMQATDASRKEILAASQTWADAFNQCDPGRIAALYDRGAAMWGTTGQNIITTPEGILQYFTAACSLPVKPKVAFVEQNVRVHGDIALNSGTYVFTAGKQALQFPARFSFAYRSVEGRWMIVDFHSSLKPVPPKPSAS